MRLTQERLEELKTMAEHARSHFCIELAEAFVRSVPDLIADLEEAQRRISISEAFAKELSSELITTRKQLAEAHALIEPYRKDAACWQFARKELCWSRSGDKEAKWVMYIEMDAPTITAGQLRDDSVAESLDAAVLAAIAAKGDSE